VFQGDNSAAFRTGEDTVKQTVREFFKEGILIGTGARTCKKGFTVVYQIDLAKVEVPTSDTQHVLYRLQAAFCGLP
jgi:hypothetical protein